MELVGKGKVVFSYLSGIHGKKGAIRNIYREGDRLIVKHNGIFVEVRYMHGYDEYWEVLNGEYRRYEQYKKRRENEMNSENAG